MKTRNNKAIILAIITLVLLVFTWPLKWSLVVEDEDDMVRLVIPITEKLEFTYYSIHSVSRTGLMEYLHVEEQEGTFVFVADKVRYEDQSGAGLPEYAYDGSRFYEEDGYFYIDGMDRVYKSLSFQVEEAYMNTLFIEGHEYLLYTWPKDRKGSVEFTIQKISLLELLKKSFKTL